MTPAKARPTFAQAARELAGFLRGEGFSDRILWLSRDRVTGRRMTRWVFRPEDLSSTSYVARRYEELRRSKTSIRLDALAEWKGFALVYLEDYGGESGFLNYGILRSPIQLQIVHSKVAWTVLKFFYKILGESPWLTKIQ